MEKTASEQAFDHALSKYMAPKKQTLWTLQDRLLEIEDAINTDETELEILIGEIGDKIDNIKYVIDIFEKEAERFKEYRDQMAARAKSLQNAADRIKAYVVKCLDAHHTSFEKGTMWAVKLRENKRIEMKTDRPTADDFMDLGLKYPVIKASYDWDKAEFKRLISEPEHDSILDDYAQIVINKSISFTAVNAAAKKAVKENTHE